MSGYTQSQNMMFATSPEAGTFPWLDYASTAVPDNHLLVLWWAKFLWLTDGNYRSAMQRVAAHFLTQIEFPDLEPDEETIWRDFFQQHLDYKSMLLGCAYDYLAFGNLFVAPYFPMVRTLVCRNCHMAHNISQVQYSVRFSTTKPYVTFTRKDPCPSCGNSDDYDVNDVLSRDFSRIRINRYGPSQIEMAYNRYSNAKKFYWKIPATEAQNIRAGAAIHIETTPIEVLEAIAVNGQLAYDDESMLHCSEVTLSDVETNGFGLPNSVSCFRTAWLQQQINKLDQAVALDYTLGLRVLSPTPTPGGQDPMVTIGNERFVSAVNSMVKEHRRNPASYHTAPYPLQYQFLGGEGGGLMPPDKLKFRQQEYLNQLGVPLEYHQMSLQTQAAPMALRLFESYWQSIPSFYDRILNWVVRLISSTYGLQPTRVVMQKTTIADDLNYKNVLLQLMSGQQVSPETALRPFGIDAQAEVKNTLRHQEYMARVQREFDEKEQARQEMGALTGMTSHPSPSMLAEQQQAAQAGGGMPPGGGMPMMGGGMGGGSGAPNNNPQTLQGMSEQAQMIAEQLVVMPDPDRKRELKALRETNRDLHGLVMSSMDRIRSEARSQGGQMLLQQGGMPQ